MTGVAILGATGSIGRSTLDVIRSLGDGFRVVGMSAGSNWEALAEAAGEFGPKRVALADESAAAKLEASGALNGAHLIAGPGASAEIAAAEDADIVVSAIVGAAGLEPTLAAVRAGKRVALANKESLVMAGALMLEEARASRATFLPVDSEHSAVFQAKAAGSDREIKRIILTASGGPFRDRPREDFEGITAEEALRHPTWDMGPKITVDSATLMNKALEIIEARWLFDVEPSRIDVWIHPQSVVHSMVEFVDGSVVAQLGLPDMRLPIQYALTYPERLPSDRAPLGPGDMSSLTFERPDTERFPALELGWRAAREGGTSGAAMSAANEVAAGAFLEGRCSFADIPRVVKAAMDAREPVEDTRLQDVRKADSAARAVARRELGLDGP